MIDLNTFEKNSSFYDQIDLALTVKSFNLKEIRERYLNSKLTNKKAGSVKRRKVAEGGIINMSINDGKVLSEEVLIKVKEPRGIAMSSSGIFAFSSENKVYLIDDKIRSIEDNWFSYIHTVDFNKKNDKLLVSSSGYDLLIEYDLKTLKKTYDWIAWENGFNKGRDPETGHQITLSRDIKGIHNEKVLVITDPKNQTLPTAMRAAFINSACYDSLDENYLLATFFYEGKLYRIDKNTGKSVTVVENLKTPHGGKRNDHNFIITSTGSGEVIIDLTTFSFKNLPGKPEVLKDEEWLQNSIRTGENYITIDSNRNAFVIFNPEKKLIDTIPYNENWAIQDMINCSLPGDTITLIKSINN